MAINWFPGHMHKAQKEIKKLMPQVDVVLEILDSRLPEASHNPLLAEHIASKPCIKLLNKKDLADPAALKAWLAYFANQSMAINAQDKNVKDIIIKLVRKLAPAERDSNLKPIRLLVVGIPNVGKSTLLNTLLGRKIAQVGNEPAVTKRQQKVKLAEDIILFDSPGVMLPRPKDEESSLALGLSGAVRDTALPYVDVGFYAVEFFATHYPKALAERYGIVDLTRPTEELVDDIARKRGCLRHGKIDLERVCKLIVHEYRSGKLGRLNLEFV